MTVNVADAFITGLSTLDEYSAVAETYKQFNAWLTMGEYEKGNDILKTVNVSTVSDAVLVAMLIVTKTNKHHFPARDAFFEKVLAKFSGEGKDPLLYKETLQFYR